MTKKPCTCIVDTKIGFLSECTLSERIYRRICPSRGSQESFGLPFQDAMGGLPPNVGLLECIDCTICPTWEGPRRCELLSIDAARLVKEALDYLFMMKWEGTPPNVVS